MQTGSGGCIKICTAKGAKRALHQKVQTSPEPLKIKKKGLSFSQ
jgi:hypothetical protein